MKIKSNMLKDTAADTSSILPPSSTAGNGELIRLTQTRYETNDRNPLLMESFEAMKGRVFKENETKLLTLLKTYPNKFINCLIKRHEGRFLSLWEGGTKILTLMNHDVDVYGNNELSVFLQERFSL